MEDGSRGYEEQKEGEIHLEADSSFSTSSEGIFTHTGGGTSRSTNTSAGKGKSASTSGGGGGNSLTSGGETYHYRVFQDIPLEVLGKLNVNEMAEISSKIDKNEQLKANLLEIEKDKKIFEENECRAWEGERFIPRIGEVDTSNALLVEIDGPGLKQTEPGIYKFLLDFQFDCMCTYLLERFAPPDTCTTAIYTSFVSPSVGEALKRAWKKIQKRSSLKEICQRHAIEALVVYNHFARSAQRPELKFKRLLASYTTILRGKLVYVTFSAINQTTHESGNYQAAVTQFNGIYYLGLLRDHSNGEICAILSLSAGSDEEIAKRKESFARWLDQANDPISSYFAD